MSASPTPAHARVVHYVPAVGPRLRKLLYFLFAMLALLGANSGYLASITALEFFTGRTYQNYFYQYMFLGHLTLGLLLLVPFLVFAITHLLNARTRKNRRAVRVGYALFAASTLILITGVLLLRVGVFDLKVPTVRAAVYWTHVVCPLLAGWLYWLHRLAGPRIKWRIGIVYGVAVGVCVAGMVMLHAEDPRQWNVVGPKEGEKYFKPSLVRTATGNFIPAKAMMMDQYCVKCHADVHAGWKESVHRFSSFNNAAYLATIKETRDVVYKRDKTMQASRWCAGCHDPVPFFSGAFDDPKFDMLNHPTAHAGITCTVCHAITHVNSNRGNADYTIEEPQHYPFAYSKNPVLQWINNQLVKAKPSFHKKTFLKRLHKTADFCSACHKVHLPRAVTHYKEFLRGQNHYDSWLLSGVSGHGARSFYYPDQAETNCNGCHMPLVASNDFGAKLFAGAKKLSIHDHLFPSANTAIAWLRNRDDVVKAHQQFLEGVMRVDLFGVKENGTIDGKLHAPLRPEVPVLKPGSTYLLETVIRTLKMGHHFTQGTVDSNQIWMDVTVTSGNRVIGRSGGMDRDGKVDPYSHFVNVFMLDKDGNRIDRRNAQDIVVPLYNHQIPPGAGQVVHYRLELPDKLTAPVTVEVKLQYRKFDTTYMDFIDRSSKADGTPIRGHKPGKKYQNRLPVTTLAVDRITFPVEGVTAKPNNRTPKFPLWQRWNDYGIGLLLEETELRQAAEAFAEVEKLGRYDGPLNLARVYNAEGSIDDAVQALARAAEQTDPPAPAWTMSWLSGLINRQQGHLEEAERNFRHVLTIHTSETDRRQFDFSLDYQVINLLGQTLFDRARQIRAPERKAERDALIHSAIDRYRRRQDDDPDDRPPGTLDVDPENVAAHYNLQLLYAELGDAEKSAAHRRLHARYKPDDNAAGRALPPARKKYPAADAAAEKLVIYKLHRPGAPGLSK